MCSEVIVAEGLGKRYRIYDRPQERLKAAILPRLQRLWGGHPRVYGRDFWALREVSFVIGKGESVGIVGKNGSGKSTLLQMICGALSPTCGKLQTHGRIAALLELGAGFNPEFTGRENVQMNGALHGLDRAQMDARFDAIAAFADIGRFIDQPVKTYSSGMFVRLAFAVIAHLDADILVVDEALAVGDAYFTQKCMRFLHGFMERGTLLFVSHDMASVKALAARSIWLENGRLMGMDKTRNIADAYLKALYGQTQAVERKAAPKPVADAAGERPAQIEEDFRLAAMAERGLENRVQAFCFNPQADGFGDGRASIVDAALLDANGYPLPDLCGGKRVTLEIRAQAHEAIDTPILGFLLRNRLGQNVFGDNTLLACRDTLPACPAGAMLRGRFTFIMPFLPRGDYSISVAVASGAYHDHVQHHWMYDALVLKSLASFLDTPADLFGMPMLSIDLDISENAEPAQRDADV
jgi:lipopolysaccharide transport system ATP-binding protein